MVTLGSGIGLDVTPGNLGSLGFLSSGVCFESLVLDGDAEGLGLIKSIGFVPPMKAGEPK